MPAKKREVSVAAPKSPYHLRVLPRSALLGTEGGGAIRIKVPSKRCRDKYEKAVVEKPPGVPLDHSIDPVVQQLRQEARDRVEAANRARRLRLRRIAAEKKRLDKLATADNLPVAVADSSVAALKSDLQVQQIIII